MGAPERPIIQTEQFPTDGLTPEQDSMLVGLLSLCRGRLSTPVFTEFARINTQSIVEVVLLREHEGVLETLLIPRPEDDIVWPGMYHTPGSAKRAADYFRRDQVVLNGAFERIQQGELGNNFAYTPIFVDNLDRLTKRGPEDVKVYIAELDPESQLKSGHIWYPVDKLSENSLFIQHQLGHVKMAADAYRKEPK